jgi:outer membrane protein OmpA-like peptidoglycan-associated protein/tetratricopeptide (TPR) repeat protein
MNRLLICFTTVALLLANTAIAAAPGSKPSRAQRVADRYYNRLAYSMATKRYERAMKRQPTYEGRARLADSYRRIHQLPQAEANYRQLMGMGNVKPEDRVLFARVLMGLNKYTEAATQLQTYLQTKPNDLQAQNLLNGCQRVQAFYADSSRYTVSITNINSTQSDFSPAFVADQLVFASARTKRRNWKYAWTDKPFLDLYTVGYDGNGPRGNIRQLNGSINSPYHEGPLVLLPGTNRVLFTRNSSQRDRAVIDTAGTINLQMFYAEQSGSTWKNVREFEYNGENYSVGHPTVTPEGKRLYFASTMPGGLGGVDIWYCDRAADGTWAAPKNAGAAINTPGDEMFPFYHSSGVMVFASNGQPGLGGLDMFTARRMGDVFEAPKNMGYPLNTTADDFGLILSANSKMGFFTSNRTGGPGDDDIYMFRIKRQVRGLVYDAETNLPLGEAVVSTTVEPIPGATPVEPILSGTNAEGLFTVPFMTNTQLQPLAMKAEHTGYLPNNVNTTVEPGGPFDEVVVKIPLRKATGDDCAATVIVEGTVRNPQTNQPVGNVQVRVTAFDTVLTADPQGRFSMPALPGRRYEVAVANAVAANPTQQTVVTSPDCEPQRLTVNLNLGPDVPMNVATGEVPFFIIYYWFDSSNIRRDASLELDSVFTYMQSHPSIVVELASHTDIRGTDPYNDDLSKRRATEAYTYLTGRGIAANRLRYKWFGEKVPAIPCTTDTACNEREHQLNRRTEFRIVGVQ